MSAADFERLQSLNARYRGKFAFPFLFAVKGSTVTAILAALSRRVESSPDAEFHEALTQVYRIASFRLQDVIPEGSQALANAPLKTPPTEPRIGD